MKGRLLDFSIQNNLGIISGNDGKRYSFVGSEWRALSTPSAGMIVDFEVRGSDAANVYVDPASAVLEGSKSKVAAGVIAVLLGGLGMHKFYLNYTSQGLTLLSLTIVGAILSIVFIGFVFLLAAWVAGLVEGIIYLSKSDEDFHRTYVVGKQPWV